jgi:hypothetical protein
LIFWKKLLEVDIVIKLWESLDLFDYAFRTDERGKTANHLTEHIFQINCVKNTTVRFD